MTINWRSPFNQVLNLFLETCCPLCGRSTSTVWCLDCQRQVQQYQWSSAQQVIRMPLPLVAWGRYDGSLKRAIAALKYENQPQLARPLGQWMAETWLAANLGDRFTVIPIPMHADKLKQRGFNQAELLARHFCHLTRLPLQTKGLTRTRATEAQFQLTSPQAREKNVAGAFAVGESLRQSTSTPPVLLLDDIFTTGATVRSAVQTLRRSGIRVGGVIVLARAGK